MKLAALIPAALLLALTSAASAQVVTNYSSLDLATMYANSPAVRVAARTPAAAMQPTAAPIVLTSRVVESSYNVQPVTYNTQPVTYNTQPVTYNTQPVTYSTQPVTYSTQPVTYSTQPVTYNAQAVTYNTQPAVQPQSVLVNSPDEGGWQQLTNRYPVQQAQFATPSTAFPSQFALQPTPATTITTLQTPSLPTTTVMPAAPLTVVTPAVTAMQPYSQIGGICGCPTTAMTPSATTLMPATTAYAQAPYYASAVAANGPYLGQGIWGQPRAYVPDQPVRNFFRYVLP